MQPHVRMAPSDCLGNFTWGVPKYDPLMHTSTVVNPLDSVIELKILEIEGLIKEIRSGATGDFSITARWFFGLKETTSSKGHVFASRVDTVHKKALRLLPAKNIEALGDFVLRQKTAACELELTQLRVGVRPRIVLADY